MFFLDEACRACSVIAENVTKTLFLEDPIVSEILSFRVFPKFTAGDYVRSSRSMQIYLRLELFRTKRETIY